ncbi:hypothetical protein L798_00635 [Zootermopsis nevadensis]|uniref:Uncharacterized protein n=1 Tax=Zootermopsis nevadensis TaxID=136037 RepID=A0A067RSK3_ZOONE|nr:hypothetical protein L798_00635 [Zootermopsis nevadensis]
MFAINCYDTEFIHLTGHQSSYNNVVFIHLGTSLLKNGLTLLPEINKEVGAQNSIDVRKPNNLDSCITFFRRQLRPCELGFVRNRSRCS